ncbi:LacI family DNA-binding transcriptional regulator [Aquimarina longa]|uniref:LacI family DNA-binding transcriptional regulator n=1 Tax=Aquimarina longa TaxID=1080221 RepID=UPI0007860992|nr:LacI family DNA-binding transcriptional regulator [Aquimarina longa]
MENKKYTIKDIADLAGVSKGTVDRVLHNRGRVSEKALESVNNVLDKIDYQPNIIARNLKNNKTYHICIVIPDPKKDEYWKPCIDGIDEAVTKYRSLGISTETFFYNPTSTHSFLNTCNKVLDQKPDAVLLPPLFHTQTVQMIDEYNSKGILVCTFNDQINAKTVKGYVGQDLYKSGRIGAQLMETITSTAAELVIIHVDETFNNSIHMQEKEKGFRSYFEKTNDTKHNITTLKIKHFDLDNTIVEYLNTNPKTEGIFVTTSKSFKIAQVLSNIPTASLKIIGYDLLEENIKYLENKKIDYLIHQNPKQQAYLSIIYIAEHFLFNKSIPKKKLLPINIINSENIETYLEY